ncbi:MAG TPA: AfsR/SARP family transcriptional regulator [Gaiellaceae bacterium]|jgi:DNA-binding SARP family transcriptional activator
MTIRYRILGPLEVRFGEEPVSLPGGKPSALLARLLLDAGRVVSVDALVDSLWADPPASAHKVVQVYVSQLRKALGPARIETRAPGYLARAGPGELDLGRFESLVASAQGAGEPSRRAELLREALSLWRGPALAEFRDEPFARAASRRLGELRLSALEQRLEADLQLGDDSRLIPELESLVTAEPLREGPRRQLMLALYRSGRQADALERYREGRRLLVDELGIEPGPALQELEQAILRQDPALGERRERSVPRRGAVVSLGSRLVDLLAPLCADGRELLLVELAADPEDLRERSVGLERLRASLVARGVEARTACFTSESASDDLARLAAEQAAELVVVAGPLRPDALERLLGAAACDVAVAPRPELGFQGSGPVLVPFGGAREEWAALELGAWIARAHGLPLRLLGSTAQGGHRDASRLLASASLALQRFAGTAAEPALVAPGPDGILAESGSLVVASLPLGELGRTRRILIERSVAPVLLVRGGLRPGGLAPDRTLTRFSWSLADSD